MLDTERTDGLYLKARHIVQNPQTNKTKGLGNSLLVLLNVGGTGVAQQLLAA